MNQPHPKRSYKQRIGILLMILVIGFGYVYIRSARASAALAASNRQLQQIIDTWAAQQPFNSTVVVAGQDGDLHAAGRNADAQMVAASTYKIYVAYAALHEVEQGTYTMRTVTRTGQTVNAALQKMILYSDNNSAQALGFLVGWQRVDQLAASAGATGTVINNYDRSGSLTSSDKHTTARDLTTMISKLERGTLLNAANTQFLLGLMKNQIHRERIPAGVPDGITVADKPGWLVAAEGDGENAQNDAAIVYGPKITYSLVIMSGSSRTQPLADLSKLIYDSLEQ